MRGEVDEPRVGDAVLLRELDPIYHSYYLYEKLKENKFIGLRSRGKVLRMSESEISIGIFDPSDDSWFDKNDGEDSTPAPTSWIRIDSEGNIDIKAGGTVNINVSGDTSIVSEGSCTIDSPDVKITGSSLTVGGSVPPSTSGPFNCIGNCIFSGAPHAGTQSKGN